MYFDTERIGNARLSSIVVGNKSFTAFDAKTGYTTRSAVLSLRDLPGPDLPILGPFDRKILTFTVPLGSNNVIL